MNGNPPTQSRLVKALSKLKAILVDFFKSLSKAFEKFTNVEIKSVGSFLAFLVILFAAATVYVVAHKNVSGSPANEFYCAMVNPKAEICKPAVATVPPVSDTSATSDELLTPFEPPSHEFSASAPIDLRNIRFGSWWPKDMPPPRPPADMVEEADLVKWVFQKKGSCGALSEYSRRFASGRFSLAAKDALAKRQLLVASIKNQRFFWISEPTASSISIARGSSSERETCLVAARAIDSPSDNCFYIQNVVLARGFTIIDAMTGSLEENSVSCDCKREPGRAALTCTVRHSYRCEFSADWAPTLEKCDY